MGSRSTQWLPNVVTTAWRAVATASLLAATREASPISACTTASGSRNSHMVSEASTSCDGISTSPAKWIRPCNMDRDTSNPRTPWPRRGAFPKNSIRAVFIGFAFALNCLVRCLTSWTILSACGLRPVELRSQACMMVCSAVSFLRKSVVSRSSQTDCGATSVGGTEAEWPRAGLLSSVLGDLAACCSCCLTSSARAAGRLSNSCRPHILLRIPIVAAA
mmetsp:Transcript_15297/g.33747  ORF Transcript_15297/g.33747 Transcript_15297/m.33747 type:complete len:219 (+) Transcript_15297:1209-1865(+)